MRKKVPTTIINLSRRFRNYAKNEDIYYTELAETSLKQRYRNHKKSFQSG